MGGAAEEEDGLLGLDEGAEGAENGTVLAEDEAAGSNLTVTDQEPLAEGEGVDSKAVLRSY